MLKRFERRFAFSWQSTKVDFTDCLIERSGYLAECVDTATFDVAVSKVAKMKLIK